MRGTNSSVWHKKCCYLIRLSNSSIYHSNYCYLTWRTFWLICTTQGLLLSHNSLWANGGPRAPPPWPSRKKKGLTTDFGRSKSEISNISEITSCRIMILGCKPIFSWSRNQINTLYNMADHYYLCKRTKNMKKSKMAANFTLYFSKCVITFVLIAMKRWFWCLNVSFHVWGFH